MAVTLGKLTALRRSAAMVHVGGSIPVDRDELVEMCEELLATRQLLLRLGTDLRAVAAKAPRPTFSDDGSVRRHGSGDR